MNVLLSHQSFTVKGTVSAFASRIIHPAPSMVLAHRNPQHILLFTAFGSKALERSLYVCGLGGGVPLLGLGSSSVTDL